LNLNEETFTGSISALPPPRKVNPQKVDVETKVAIPDEEKAEFAGADVKFGFVKQELDST